MIVVNLQILEMALLQQSTWACLIRYPIIQHAHYYWMNCVNESFKILCMNKNADDFSLWGFIPCRRYLQLCILISECSCPAHIEVSGKTQLLKWKQDQCKIWKGRIYSKWVSEWWPISCRLLFTMLPEMTLPLTFYYPEIIQCVTSSYHCCMFAFFQVYRERAPGQSTVDEIIDFTRGLWKSGPNSALT